MKLVFDADGLIKLVRSGIFPELPCFISKMVWNETVVEGKKRLYEDAFEIEKLIEQRKITVLEVNYHPRQGLGAGELSTLALWKKIKADAIVSDDRKFLQVLEEENVPFIIPSELIVKLVKIKNITIAEAQKAIANIKELIRKDNYNSALAALGGKP